MRVQHDSQCEDGYLEWYLTVSHPRIIPPVDHTNDVGVLVDDMSLPPPPSADADDQQRLQMIAVVMDNLMGLVNLDCDSFTRLSRATHIARVRPI